MNPFIYLTPTSINEALGMLSEHGDDAKIIAGGTALITMMKQRLLMPEVLISLDRIEECRKVAVVNHELRIGGLMSHQEILTHPLISEHFPALVETLKEVSNTRIRNVATLGGALAHADPNQDSLVILLALNARVDLRKNEDTRTLPLSDFFVDYYETELEPEEIITEISIPLPHPKTGSAFKKFLPRSLEDYGVVSVAASLTESEGVCQTCQIALGCVADTPVRATAAEAFLIGKSLSEARILQAAEASKEVTDPVSDSRGSGSYKKKMAGVFVKRVLMEAWNRL